MATQGASTIAAISARIFGNFIGNGMRSGRKYLMEPLKGPAIISYYPGEVEDFAEDDYKSQETVNAERRLIRLKNRGKSAPKKGEGKRSKKKK